MRKFIKRLRANKNRYGSVELLLALLYFIAGNVDFSECDFNIEEFEKQFKDDNK